MSTPVTISSLIDAALAERWARIRRRNPRRDIDRLSVSLGLVDMERLLAYCDRYTLESRGFGADEAGRLMFLRFLIETGRLWS